MKLGLLTLEIAVDPAGNFVLLARCRQHLPLNFWDCRLVWIWEVRVWGSPVRPIAFYVLIAVGLAVGQGAHTGGAMGVSVLRHRAVCAKALGHGVDEVHSESWPAEAEGEVEGCGVRGGVVGWAGEVVPWIPSKEGPSLNLRVCVGKLGTHLRSEC